MRRIPRVCAISVLATAALAACGGSDSDDSAPPTPPTPASLNIGGTAATGAAIAGATVEAKCKTGSGSATTSAAGVYAIAISGGELPCVARVTAADGTVLHTVAAGSGASSTAVTAHLTPVTELVVASLAGADTAGYYDAFGASSAVTSAQVQGAAGSVGAMLKSAGVDLGTASDPIAGTLVPSASGDAYDQALLALKAKLDAAGTTLATLAHTVARGSSASTTTSTVASLPPELLLAPAAPNCPALRSGKYRLIVNDSESPQTALLTLDAAALKLTDDTQQVYTLTATGDCSYTLDNAGGSELVVTAAGVIVARVAHRDAPPLQAAVLFPEQTHTVAELAGEWNTMAFDRTEDNGPIHLTSATVTIDAAGKVTALNFCDDLRNCSVPATLPDIVATPNAEGGFDWTSKTEGWTDRLFAYRAGGGELMVVTISPNGHISFVTRKAAVAMPPVGGVQQNWNVSITAQYTAPSAISNSKNTVESVDTAAGSYLRQNVINQTTGATRPETLVINSLRDGYVRRLPATGVTASDGSTSNVAEFIALGMRGMNLSVLALPATNQMQLSPIKAIVNP
ncbi:hypothetical protein SNE35_04650 [Paucibacter sp. R3-3]|uniref:Carboxypeptidase regulatory-like domain-containing protein n=1 Tax=Roseateles agri TaxID=3098619 RepID=A0ABU5DBX0_9BURK|nr:hypothetical protein [Paucibacter sp. R3-3]MDY0743779.1 hypothetical protein [Paucibacter sp. R3-3]